MNAASFILSAAVGGGKGGKKGAAAKKVKRTGKTLWNPKKFEAKQWFSQTAYLNVTEIAGNRVTVENSFGNLLYVSKDILEGMYSADHFKKEVPVNMTALAELLHSVQDHIFTVEFRKQPTEENAAELLEKTDAKTFKDPKKLAQLSKDLIAGQTVKMTCHLIQVENNLGRSLVIDLSSKSANKFRQIDHRSLDYIIFQNVKYVLKKGAKKMEDEEHKKDEPKWDTKRLAVGNWFSGTSYYQAVTDKGDQVICRSQGKDIEISKDILEYEMHNSSVHDEEQKISLTQVATVLAEANSKCFTVCFTTKVDEKMVLEKLKGIKGKLSAA